MIEIILTLLQENRPETVAQMIPVHLITIYRIKKYYIGKTENPKRTLTQEQADSIKEMLKTKTTYSIWKETGYSKGLIHSIKIGKSYQ
jgi:hypothetical protein